MVDSNFFFDIYQGTLTIILRIILRPRNILADIILFYDHWETPGERDRLQKRWFIGELIDTREMRKIVEFLGLDLA